jgi:hypothetical protein
MTLAALLSFGLTFFGFTLFSLLDLFNARVGDSEKSETRRFAIASAIKILWVFWFVISLHLAGKAMNISEEYSKALLIYIIGGCVVGFLLYGFFEQEIVKMRNKLNSDHPFVPWHKRKKTTDDPR